MIVAAAIKRDGVVYVGKRHADVILRMGTDFKLRVTVESLTTDVQGFVTGDLRFLDRNDAQRHAVECGQIPASHIGRLTSDDLWPE